MDEVGHKGKLSFETFFQLTFTLQFF